MQSADPGFDLFILVRSYSPTFCLAEECTRRPVSAFTIHGLWPEYNNGAWPEYCNTSDGSSISSSSGQQAPVAAGAALQQQPSAHAAEVLQPGQQQLAGHAEQAAEVGEAELEAALAGSGPKGAATASLGKWRPHWHRKKKKKKHHPSPPPPPPPEAQSPEPQPGPPPATPADPAKQQQCEWPSFRGTSELLPSSGHAAHGLPGVAAGWRGWHLRSAHAAAPSHICCSLPAAYCGCCITAP